jgi:fermentation-respiration switch protein FrsA (DUF1100 family)
MLKYAAALGVCFVLLVLLAWAFQRRLIYFPLRGVPAPEAVGLAGVETVRFSTDDGLVLNGWFVPRLSPDRTETLIVFNGNAGNRAYRAPLARSLAQHGIASFLFDYRGYGDNPGTPGERGLASDAAAARRYVASRADVDQSGVIYFGESLGAAVALNLAVRRAPGALVLRSPFTSLADVGGHHYPFLPVRWLLRDRYPSSDLVGRLSCPLLVIAADDDSIVPSSQSIRLYESANEPKRLLVVPNTDHNDYELLAGPLMIREILRFLDTLRRE